MDLISISTLLNRGMIKYIFSSWILIQN